MYSIIDRIFNGEATPYGRSLTETYKELMREFGDTAEHLCETLTPPQQKSFDEVLNRFTDLCHRENQEMFYTGFCMGGRVMMEMLQYIL